MALGQIFTIGHGPHTPATLVEQLSIRGVQFLIDVRSVPYSRHQPDFSREVLKRHLIPSRIRYVFMGDLLGGRPEDEDCYTHEGRVDYAKVRTKDFFVRGISRLLDARRQGFKVCLFCSEGHPSQCHRAKLIGHALVDEGVETLHIRPNGSVQTQADVMDELTGRQESLFASLLFSRGTYR